MRFYIRERAVQRFAPVPRPAFKRVGVKSFKWGSVGEAHIFTDFSEIPAKFLTQAGSLKRRYVLVVQNNKAP